MRRGKPEESLVPHEGLERTALRLTAEYDTQPGQGLRNAELRRGISFPSVKMPHIREWTRLCTKSPKSHPRQWVDWFRSFLRKYS